MERNSTYKFTLTLLFLLLPSLLWAGAPTSTYTYVTGEPIEPNEVQQETTNIYRYLQSGVDTLADNSVTTSKILDGTIVNADISGSAGIAYSKLNLTGLIVNADISPSAAIVDTKLAQITTASKVNGAALTGFASIPSGAGNIPSANLGNATTFETGMFTRDISLTGSQEVNLVGAFQPKLVLFFASFASYGYSIGAYDGTRVSMATIVGTTPIYTYNTADCIYIFDGTNGAEAVPNSLDSDGFTITWIKSQSPTGTAGITYVAYK